MIYVMVLFFAAGAALQGYFTWKDRNLREGWVSLGLVVVGVLLTSLYYADFNERLNLLVVLERLFHPLTQWIYDAL